MRDFYVYVIYRANGTPCYVGKGTGDRFLHHLTKSHNPIVRRIVAKERDEISIKKVSENLSEEEAFAEEIRLIASIGRLAHGGPLSNLTDGGEGVRRKQTPEQLRKLAAARRGRIHGEEMRAKISATLTGKVKSEAHRLASQAAKKGKKIAPWSAEARATRQANRKPFSPEQLAAISVAATKRHALNRANYADCLLSAF